MGTGGTLSHNRRQFLHQTKDFGRQKSDYHVRIFSGLESFCSVVSSAGKYSRGEKPGPALWKPQEPPLWRRQGRGRCFGFAAITEKSPCGAPVPCSVAQPPACPWQRPQEPGTPGSAGPGDSSNPCPVLAGLPTGTGCPHHRCRCHQESFERVPTLSPSSLFSTRKI